MLIIEAIDVCRSFKNGNIVVDVLDHINVSFEKATFNVLMGPSGSGKTTLINILGALDRPDHGKVLFEGKDIAAASVHERDSIRREKIGFVYQSIALVSFLTALENIELSLRVSGYNGSDRLKRAEECLDFVGLKKRKKHFPAELSGGEQQRVAIARAIAKKPVLILADEPTAELDTNTGLLMVKLFRELVEQQKITVIMCTHDVNMMEVADSIFNMEEGVFVNGK